MELASADQPKLFQTAQRPGGTIPVSVASLPAGFTEEQRSLANEILLLFNQYEQAEFGDPNRNTFRARMDRFDKVLSKFSCDSVSELLQKDDLISAIAEGINQHLPQLPTKTTSRPKTGQAATGSVSSGPRSEKLVPVGDQKSKGKSEPVSDGKTQAVTGEDLKGAIETALVRSLDEAKGQLDSIKSALVELADESSREIDQITAGIEGLNPTPGKAPGRGRQRGKAGARRPARRTRTTTRRRGRAGTAVRRTATQAKATATKAAAAPAKAASRVLRSLGRRTTGQRSSITRAMTAVRRMSATQMRGVSQTSRSIDRIGKSLSGYRGRLTRAERRRMDATGKAMTAGIGRETRFNLKLPAKRLMQQIKRNWWKLALGFILTPTGMYVLGYIYGTLAKFLKLGLVGMLTAVRDGIAHLWEMFKNWWSGSRAKEVVDGIKKKLRKEWDEAKKKYPWLGTLEKELSDIAKAVGSFTSAIADKTEAFVEDTKEWWKDKKETYELGWQEYLAKTGETEDRMTKGEFYAECIHQDIVKSVERISEFANNLMETMAPLVNMVSGIFNWFAANPWVMKLLMMTLVGPNNKASITINSIIGLVYGPIGLGIANLISSTIQEAVIALYNKAFNRDTMRIRTSSRLMKLNGQTLEQATEGTKKRISKINLDAFAKVEMVDIKGQAITSNEGKRERLFELIDKFNENMGEDISKMDALVLELNKLRLVSEGGNSVSNANSMLSIFKNTDILERVILPFTQYPVTNMLGLEKSKILETLERYDNRNNFAQIGNGWRHRAVNAIGVSLVRLKLTMLSKIYRNVLDMMDQKDLSDQEKISVLYSALDPHGEIYKQITASISQASLPTDKLLAVLWKHYTDYKGSDQNIFEDVNSALMKSNSAGNGIKALDNWAEILGKQSKLTEQSRTAVAVGRAVHSVAAIKDNIDETLKGSDAHTVIVPFAGDVDLEKLPFLVRNSPALFAIRNMQTQAVYTTSVLTPMFSSEAAKGIRAEGLKAIGTKSGKETGIDIGSTHDLWGGYTIAHWATRNPKDTAIAIQEMMKYGFAKTDLSFNNEIVRGFMQDLLYVGQDFAKTSRKLDEQVTRLEATAEGITATSLVGMDKFGRRNGALNQSTAEAAMKFLGGDPEKIRKMDAFMAKVGETLTTIAGDQSMAFEKYRDMDIMHIVKDVVDTQAVEAGLSRGELDYVNAYLKNHFVDAELQVREALKNAAQLKQSLMDVLADQKRTLQRAADAKAAAKSGQTPPPKPAPKPIAAPVYRNPRSHQNVPAKSRGKPSWRGGH